MNKNQSGFGLLETICSFMIFIFLLQGLWGFFSNIYFNYMVFNKQVELDNKGESIESFIKTYIREADLVKIHAGGEVITYDSDLDRTYEELRLLKIELETTTSSKESITATIEYNPLAKQLSYKNKGKNIIADDIDNITVSRLEGSNLIEFSCELSTQINSDDPESQRKKVTTDFSQSIDYKKPFPE